MGRIVSRFSQGVRGFPTTRHDSWRPRGRYFIAQMPGFTCHHNGDAQPGQRLFEMFTSLTRGGDFQRKHVVNLTILTVLVTLN